MAKETTCEICKVNPTGTSDYERKMCDPCWEYAGWENTHSDEGHEQIIAHLKNLDIASAVELREMAKGYVNNTGKARMKSEPLRAALRAKFEETRSLCWVCFPELVPAPKKRRATPTLSGAPRPSRKGQKINVPLRAPGVDKATIVWRVAGEDRASITSLGGGVVVLDVNLGDGITLHLAWDVEGRYDYEESYVRVGGKRKSVRNVAEALRIIRA